MLHLQATDPQLFVHLTWKTKDNRPLLGNDQLRQAAYLAVTARTRALFCRVLAIGGTTCQINMVASFPASLPITSLLRISHEAAQDALEGLQGTMSGDVPDIPCYWAPEYTAHTLNAAEAAEAKAYLRQRLGD